MIHVLDYEGKIIDFISQSDEDIIEAKHSRNINERTETFDFTILSSRTTHLQEKNRIIIQDSNNAYREFIIEHISQDINGYTEIETNASYLEDISKSKPYPPYKFTGMTTRQALSDVLKDTGWQVSDQTEYGGTRSTSWTSYQTRYEVLLQLCTTYKMEVDFFVELGSNTVDGRYVVLRKSNPLFEGKEITYGKDLTGLSRTVDFSDLKTALLCVGPEREDGERLELVVTDDEAQANFGLPGRYLWGIYEPETDDENMTETRLRTLGTTELNKRKQALISYEVSSLDIKQAYPHEIIRIGDKVRIKNRDFTPPLYVEAEVISEEYDLISGESTYGFGQYKEYSESELRSIFDKKLDNIRAKLNDNISNINTIVQQSIDGQLQYFEKKIIKSSTAPEHPVNDMLWYDTSNPHVAVLRRYWNGEWLEETAKDVEQIGGITREKALFSELQNTFTNLEIQHARQQNEFYSVMNNEYLVDTDLKNNLNEAFDKVQKPFENIKAKLEAMKPETATIGELTDIQALFVKYRQQLQDFYTALENAKVAIDKRFKLLQSQYTDEKYNDAMNAIASTLPNGHWDADKQELTSDIPNKDDLDKMKSALQDMLNGNLETLKNEIGEQTDNKINTAKDEISARVSSVKKDLEDVDSQLGTLTPRVTTTENNIEVLKQGLKLSATQQDVKQMIDSELNTVKTDVANQKASLDVLSNQIDSKVSSQDYTSDKDNIIRRLNSADSERNQLSNEINDRVTLKDFNDMRVGGCNYLPTNNWEYGTFNFNNGMPTSVTNNRIRNIYPISVDSTSYVLKVFKPVENEVLQACIYQYDDNGIYIKNSSFIDVNDTTKITFSDDVKQVKLLLRYQSNNLINIDDIKQAKLQLEKGTISTDYRTPEEDITETMNVMQTSIEQNGKSISLKASKQEFDATNKTLSNIISEVTNNTTTGITFTYDENGTIQKMNVGKDGIKLRGDKVDIRVNKDFNVLASNVNDKVSKDDIINRLNLSPEGLNIDVNNVGIHGGDKTSYVQIQNDTIEMGGVYTRTWQGVRSKENVFTRLKNGTLRFRNNRLSRSLYYSDFGISTYEDGEGDDDSSGTISFFDYSYSPNARGITISSANGTLAMRADNNRIVLESETTTNIVSNQYSVYIRPFSKSRPGLNEFGFYIKDNDNAGATDGALLYGEISDTKGVAGSGIRFKKSGVQGYDNMESIVYATDSSGTIGTGSFHASKFYGDFQSRSGYLYLMADNRVRITDYKGYNGGNPTYGDLQCNEIQAGSIRTINTNFYVGVSTGELRVTNNLLYNGGKPGYKPVKASAYNNASKIEYKKDVNEWNESVSERIKNELDFYSYRYKTEHDEVKKHHGFVIGEGYNIIDEFVRDDSVNIYELATWSLKAIKEQIHRNDQLEEKIKKLEALVNE